MGGMSKKMAAAWAEVTATTAAHNGALAAADEARTARWSEYDRLVKADNEARKLEYDAMRKKWKAIDRLIGIIQREVSADLRPLFSIALRKNLCLVGVVRHQPGLDGGADDWGVGVYVFDRTEEGWAPDGSMTWVSNKSSLPQTPLAVVGVGVSLENRHHLAAMIEQVLGLI